MRIQMGFTHYILGITLILTLVAANPYRPPTRSSKLPLNTQWPDSTGHYTVYGVQCLVAGCRGSGAGSRLCVQEEGCCTTQCQGVHHLQSYYNRDGVCRYCAPGTEYLSRLNIGISLWRERRGATLRLSGYPVFMGVWRYENRAAKSVVFRDIAVDTRPSVVTSVRTCFAVPRPKMNLDDWKENDLSGHSMKHKR